MEKKGAPYGITARFNHLPLGSKLRALLVGTLLPMVILVVVVISTMVQNSAKYDQIVQNLTVASEFSFDFKNNIDYKAYRYVIAKKDFDSYGMLEDIDQARGVVERLQQTATDPDSLSRLRTINGDLDKLEDGVLE